MTDDGIDVEPIPPEILEAARLRLKRNMAALLTRGLAESGLTTEEVEARLGRKRGFVWRYLRSLISGKSRDLDMLSDMCVALGIEIQFRFVRLEDLIPSQETPTEDKP